VVLSGHVSAEVATTNAGVPQGSILRSLLLEIVINNIEIDVKLDMHLHADDVALSITPTDSPL